MNDWLLAGDPAVRWQVHRDLLDSPPDVVARERAEVARTGWGARLLALQGPDGRWAADRGPGAFRGLYVPKWTSTTYTMKLLVQLGVPTDDPRARAGCDTLVRGAEWFPSGGLGFFASRRIAEPCVSAMVGLALETFGGDAGARERLERYLLAEQKPDGGWNCDEESDGFSFDTTLAAIELLSLRPPTPAVRDAVTRGRQRLLAQHLFRSVRTGAVVKHTYTLLRWNVGWGYDVLRALEVLAPGDPRADDALDLIERRRRPDGTWAANRREPGALHFELEPAGEPSRWITMRCARVLRRWGR